MERNESSSGPDELGSPGSKIPRKRVMAKSHANVYYYRVKIQVQNSVGVGGRWLSFVICISRLGKMETQTL